MPDNLWGAKEEKIKHVDSPVLHRVNHLKCGNLVLLKRSKDLSLKITFLF